jgi:anaerobic magnesium-protoporphyrin IX monomethyl ester cyclase
MTRKERRLATAIRRGLEVALIRPPILQLKANLSAYGAIPPIGLAYVAAVLRDAGHSLVVIDAPGEAIDQHDEVASPIGPLRRSGLNPEQIAERLSPTTQVLGITHMFLHEWPTIRAIAELAKAKIPGLVVVVGGENATAFWKWMFEQSDAVDYCVLGEGEATMLDLLECLENGQDPAMLVGVAARRSAPGTVKLSERRRTLDEVPRPAWDLFPIGNYLEQKDNHGVNRGRSMPILATRGCPYQCTFCSSPSMWTTKYVTREPADVVAEIQDYVTRYRATNFNFCDLTAIVKKEWIVEFCQRLQRENLAITWQLPTGTRTEALDGEVLALLDATGCRNITYAPESGSARMLQVLKKKVLLPRMLDCLRAARKVGIVTRVNIIIGHPKEEWSDTRQSLKFLFQAALAGCQDAAVMIFAPYPGSHDFEELMASGKVELTPEYYYLALARSGATPRVYNSRMTPKQVVTAQFSMLLAFYATAYLTRPWRFFGVLRSLFTGQESTQLDQLLRTKFRQMIPGRRREEAAATATST